jgi:hypothetical protein
MDRDIYLTGKKKNHMYWYMMFCIGLACCTYVLPMATLNVGARYFGMMLMPCASGQLDDGG